MCPLVKMMWGWVRPSSVARPMLSHAATWRINLAQAQFTCLITQHKTANAGQAWDRHSEAYTYLVSLNPYTHGIIRSVSSMCWTQTRIVSLGWQVQSGIGTPRLNTRTP